MNTFVVAGIGTGIGKTVISAVLAEALKADYWKPVQAGDLDSSDTLTVQSLVSNTHSVFHKEAYRLQSPMSPHAAAKIDGIEIELKQLSIPATNNTLIIELAGGLMVPLNPTQLNIDLLQHWKVPVILVSRNYLGSINHTLLSLELLKSKSIPLAGLIFNGEKNTATEEFILNYSRVKCLGHIPDLSKTDRQQIKAIAEQLKLTL